MRFANFNARASAIAAIVAIVLAGCRPGAGGGGAGGDLTLSITSPANGAEVSVPFNVELESNVEFGAPDTGNHHVHLYFDADVGSEDYEMVFGTTAEVTRDLAPGEHRIVASLRNADHSDAGPTQEITVTVVEGDGASDGEGSPSPTSDDGGIDY